MTTIAIVLLVAFQAYALCIVSKKMKALEDKVDFLEEHPNKLRKIPAALEKIPWTAATLDDGTEICTIEKYIQLNSDAMEEFNKTMELLGSVHATIYKKGTWINTPLENAASFRISWYKDLNMAQKTSSKELEEMTELKNTGL